MMSLSFLEIWTYRVGVGSIITWLKISKAKGRYVFSWRGRAGASERRVISESEHQRGRAIPSFSAIQGEGHTFSRIFNGDFCDVIFHFSLTD